MFNSSAIPWTVAHKTPLSLEFPRQEYWRGLPFPSPGDLPDPKVKSVSPALADRFFTTEPPENQIHECVGEKCCFYLPLDIEVP